MDCHHYHFGACQSCTLLNRTFEDAVTVRQSRLAGLFPGIQILPWISAANTEGSRIRGRFAVSGSSSDPRIGFFDDARRIIPVADCPLHHALINAFAAQLPDIIRSARLVPYDLATRAGELKFVVVTCSPSHQQLMVQFVLRSRESVDRIRSLWNRQRGLWPAVSIVSAGLQPDHSSRIIASQTIPVSDELCLPVRFGKTELLFGPQSFLQTNFDIAGQLYEAAGQLLQNADIRTVLDLYCGAGAFSLISVPSAASVLGVDVSEDAVAAARISAVRNNRRHAEFLAHDLQTPCTELFERSFDAVICNPPRRGLDDPTIDLLRRLNPKHLLYSSCNADSLQRDTAKLAGQFQLQQLQPFDMFPWTSHFEVLAWLTRDRP